MATQLYGGSFSDFADSMAQEIETALDEVRVEAGLEPLPDPNTADPEDLENRRMLFLAIARGVIRHLEKKEAAFSLTFQVGAITVTTHPDIQVKP